MDNQYILIDDHNSIQECQVKADSFFMASYSLKIKENLKSPRCPWQEKTAYFCMQVSEQPIW